MPRHLGQVALLLGASATWRPAFGRGASLFCPPCTVSSLLDYVISTSKHAFGDRLLVMVNGPRPLLQTRCCHDRLRVVQSRSGWRHTTPRPLLQTGVMAGCASFGVDLVRSMPRYHADSSMCWLLPPYPLSRSSLGISVLSRRLHSAWLGRSSSRAASSPFGRLLFLCIVALPCVATLLCVSFAVLCCELHSAMSEFDCDLL